MSVRAEDWVGRSLMAVRRLHFQVPGTADAAEGAVEFVWSDRSILRVDAVHGCLSVTDRPWRDPFEDRPPPVPRDEVVRVGRWVRRDVSRSSPYDGLISRFLTTAEANDSLVVLNFGGVRVEVSLPGVDPRVTVTQPVERREWWRVEWMPNPYGEPTTLLYELVDGVERRKVEIWRDGRRGAASAFTEHGGSTHATESFPSLEGINREAQFRGEVISAERFQTEWRAALDGVPSTTLWRPTGPQELVLVEASGWHRWPQRLPDQPIFYPVTTREYAERIAREWNVPAFGVGYVTRFDVARAFMDRFAVQQAGGSGLTEWWVPAEELDDLNDHIVGTIEVVEEIRK